MEERQLGAGHAEPDPPVSVVDGRLVRVAPQVVYDLEHDTQKEPPHDDGHGWHLVPAALPQGGG